MKSSENAEQKNGADRRHEDGGKIESFRIPETKEAADEEAADEGADDAYNKVGQQTMVAAGNPLGEPTGQNTNDDTSYYAHGSLLIYSSVERTPALKVCSAARLDVQRSANAGMITAPCAPRTALPAPL